MNKQYLTEVICYKKYDQKLPSPRNNIMLNNSKLLVEMFAYLLNIEEIHHILIRQYEHYRMVDQAEQQMLLVEISAYLHDYEGTHYIPLEQQNHNWVVDHVNMTYVTSMSKLMTITTL